jgi:threonylcarbamoyladenosine tRNA methylthiotransferase MtaB
MSYTPGNASLFTIGCRLNQADSSLISDRLERDGWKIVRHDYDGRIDLFVVNTCTVTGSASQKSRQAVRRFRKNHPEACIVVTGCSAEMDKSSWIEESAVDLLLTNPEKKDIGELLVNFLEKKSISTGRKFSMDESVDTFKEKARGRFHFKSRAFLKVQEGCNNFCSYCIVPYARGPERSRDSEEVITDFKEFLKAGFHEIVLTGVNICAYNDSGKRLVDLLEELCAIPGDFRIRLSSTEPHPNNMELLDVMRDNPKICRFLHLSLQHGTDEILKAMNRKYTAEEFAQFIFAAREKIPDIHLGTDIIVGFPGETDELFAKELEFVRRMAFANIHIFTFSPREGTPAAEMNDRIPADVAKARYRQLDVLAQEQKKAFVESQLGKKLNVIFERKQRDGFFTGWSDNYLNVRCDDANIKKNILTQVFAKKVLPDNSIIAELI